MQIFIHSVADICGGLPLSVSENIQKAVEKATGASASRCGCDFVVETFGGGKRWRGIVDIYDTAKGRAFGGATEEGEQVVTIMEQDAVDSAQAAVKTWLTSEQR